MQVQRISSLELSNLRKQQMLNRFLKVEHTINDHLPDFFKFIQTYRKIKTWYEYRYMINNYVAPAIGNFYPETITLAQTDLVLEYCEAKQKSISIKHRAMCCTRVFFYWIKRNGTQTQFDYRDIILPKIPTRIVEWLNIEEINRLRAAFPGDDEQSLRTRALLELMLCSGLRISEACSINKDDIDWEKKEIKVMGKGDKEAVVYFTDTAAGWLRRYIHDRKWDHEALFMSGRSRLLSVSARNYLRVKTKGLFRKKMCHHLMRKSFVTHLIQRGADIKTVQVLARHDSPRTTLKHYAGVDNDRAKEIHQKLLSNL